eukprot:GILI01015168.1.p1 GENE.GILI01015168.1~~GILI01015168.1.p1  ORF type:complete len:407 (+),score=20.54 GILI01015168.1:42-1223(+)
MKSYADILKGTTTASQPPSPSVASSSPSPTKLIVSSGPQPAPSDVSKDVLKRWSEEQNRLAPLVVIDDAALGFTFKNATPEDKSGATTVNVTSPTVAATLPTVVASPTTASNQPSRPKAQKGNKSGAVSANTCLDIKIPSMPVGATPCVNPGLAPVSTASVSEQWADNATATLPPLRVVAGVDISFVKDTDLAVASLAILSFPELEVIHTTMHHVRMTEPYIPGYLAFREVPLVKPLLDEVRAKLPKHLHPQILFVDGNGVHHPRKFGFASHLGVLCDIPAIGCAKNLLMVDGFGKIEAQDCLNKWFETDKKGPIMPLISPNSNIFWGYAALTGNSIKNPIFVSPGHRVGFETAMALVMAVTLFRVPEPIRQADLLSRKYIKDHFSVELDKCQ